MSIAGRTMIVLERLLRSQPATANPQSVLVLEYFLPLGCCVNLTPLYEAIKRSRPDVTLTVASYGLAAQLLRHNPHIDHLIETPDALTETLAAARHLRAELRRRDLHPNLTLNGASDNRIRVGLLAFLAAPAQRAGYTRFPQLYHHALDYDFNRSLIDNNLRLAAKAACSPAHREPTVFFSATDLVTAHALAAEANPTGKPLLILVTQPSGGQATCWHQDRFAEVARKAHDLGCALAYVGIAADHEPIEALRAAVAEASSDVAGNNAKASHGHKTHGAKSDAKGTNLAGRTTVTELAALLAISDYLVSLDTGTMHLGRAVGIPLVVLSPSWQKPLEWLPLGIPTARILRGPDRDVVSADYKLDEITAPQVLDALEELVATYPPSPEARASRQAHCLSSVDHLPLASGSVPLLL